MNTTTTTYRTVVRDDDAILAVYESADRRKVRNAARRAVRQLQRTRRVYARATDTAAIGVQKTVQGRVRWWLETANARGTHRTDQRARSMRHARHCVAKAQGGAQ